MRHKSDSTYVDEMSYPTEEEYGGEWEVVCAAGISKGRGNRITKGKGKGSARGTGKVQNRKRWNQGDPEHPRTNATTAETEKQGGQMSQGEDQGQGQDERLRCGQRGGRRSPFVDTTQDLGEP